MRIDSHHHLWQYHPDDFGWIPEGMGNLRQDFLYSDLVAAAAETPVQGTVLVQTLESVDHTHWLLRQAARHQGDRPRILGVVGWAPLVSPHFAEELERLMADPYLKGLRHILQGEDGAFFRDGAFRGGMAVLAQTRLVYDLLVVERQLPLAVELVNAFPAQTFVLDHLGKPEVLGGDFQSWRCHLQELARHPGVSCKLSGLVTEADPRCWTAAQLTPYLEAALECFGPERLMIGTDWPVCTVGCSYAAWWQLVEAWAAPLTAGERDAILGGTAARVYRLNPGVDGIAKAAP